MIHKKWVKYGISLVVGFIIDQSFSITSHISDALTPFMSGQYSAPLKPLIVLSFFLLEWWGTYELLEKLTIFKRLIK
mgnify:CR=1 FL=1